MSTSPVASSTEPVFSEKSLIASSSFFAPESSPAAILSMGPVSTPDVSWDSPNNALISETFPFITSGRHSLINLSAISIRSFEQVMPTRSMTFGTPLKKAALPDISTDLALASVILARLTESPPAMAVMPDTSSGCSAMIGLAPAMSTRLAQSLMAIGLVMQWMRGLSVLTFSIMLNRSISIN